MKVDLDKVEIVCTSCHRPRTIKVSDPSIYNEVVRENFVCLICLTTVKKVKITFPCNGCQKLYVTSVLVKNREKYLSPDWKGPCCLEAKDIIKDKHSHKLTTHDCYSCKSSKGVCFHPEHNCVRSKNFVPFGCNNLYALNKDCTILSIDAIDDSRTDIHCFKYSLLYNENYSISVKNLVMIKQRIGSKSNFKNHISLFKYDEVQKKFVEFYTKEFDRGNDWIIVVKNFIVKSKFLPFLA